jgi:hypothetical protein
MRGGFVYTMSNRPNRTLYTGVTADIVRRLYEWPCWMTVLGGRLRHGAVLRITSERRGWRSFARHDREGTVASFADEAAVVHHDNAPIPHTICRTSVSRPVTAAAAAIAGDSRCVRPPWPCRPSKLRFDVLAQR